MKPFVIKDANKIYTKEELQKNSEYPLFDDFYIGEDPKSIDIYNNYQKKSSSSIEDYMPLDKKYIKLLPEYVQVFAKNILIGPKDDVQIDLPFTDEVVVAIQLKHGLSEKPSRKDIINILTSDLNEFYKKFGANKAIKALRS